MLDVGPGPFPHPRANFYLDTDGDNIRRLEADGKKTFHANLMSGLPEIPDKHFDYVWCSHVLEHVPHPALAAKTLSRIAKAGTVVLPSAIKESLFNFEEVDHKWLILPGPKGSGPVFVKHDAEYMEAVKNCDVQKITSRLFRTGPNRIHPEQRFLRSWFYHNEQKLDVVVHWEDEFKVQVIG
jgi:SAM-dependent methyltransferase